MRYINLRFTYLLTYFGSFWGKLPADKQRRLRSLLGGGKKVIASIALCSGALTCRMLA